MKGEHMNKKRFLLIPAGLLFFIMLIYTSSSYDSSRFLFVIRNVLISLFLGSLIVIAMIFIKDFLIARWAEKSRLIKISVGVFGLAILGVVGEIQYRIIEVYEIPDMVACDYYDGYNNLIYASVGDECPVLSKDVIGVSYDKIALEFQEQIRNGYETRYYYSSVDVEYTSGVMTSYIKTVYYTNELGMSNISKMVQTVELTEDTVTMTHTFYIKSNPETSITEYHDYEFDQYSYQSVSIATIGTMVSDDSAALTITRTTDYPELDNEISDTLEGTASIYFLEYCVDSDFFRYYVRQSPTAISARYNETSNISIYSLFNYDSVTKTLSNVLGYVDIVDSIRNQDDIIFPEVYEIEAVPDLYEYSLYVGDELRYDLDGLGFLKIEKKYSIDHSPSTSTAEQYFIDRALWNFSETNNFSRLFDLSDYQYYLVKRYNPLVDCILKLMEDYHG